MKNDFHCIGKWLDIIEAKIDGTVKGVNQNSTMISSLQEQLDQVNAKIWKIGPNYITSEFVVY